MTNCGALRPMAQQRASTVIMKHAGFIFEEPGMYIMGSKRSPFG